MTGEPSYSVVNSSGKWPEQLINLSMVKKLDDHNIAIQAKMNGFYALKGLGSDWNGIVALTCRVIDAILTDSNEVFSVAVNQPQFNGYVSYPVQLNRQGVGNYVLMPLYPLETEQIKVAANAIQEQLATINNLLK